MMGLSHLRKGWNPHFVWLFCPMSHLKKQAKPPMKHGKKAYWQTLVNSACKVRPI